MSEKDTPNKIPRPGSLAEAVANDTIRENPDFVAPRVDMQEIEKRQRQQAIDNRSKEGPIEVNCAVCNTSLLRRVQTKRSNQGLKGGTRRTTPQVEISYACVSCGISYDKEIIERKLEALKKAKVV